ncbi:Histone-lysine N-methyltransferase EHMT1 [Pseudolycoriella hygida]|uniref:Histone-lysine N-methyltransferase EHMT1 n=1 Tax=Pseudolycoriella hygida TaxID=35572 RepID=A0A9Q0MLZ7_9DIPT|nr:Histone-lysine N-methyltransferase EHMT1 [Pseudolycoriella hygida]
MISPPNSTSTCHFFSKNCTRRRRRIWYTKMNSEIDILEVMSSKFNENSPENTSEDIAIAEDKTLKWRRLKNNKFASARRKSIGEGGVKEDKDSAVTGKDKQSECASDNDKNNRVLRRNKPSSVISVARSSLKDKKNKIIKTRGSIVRRGKKSLNVNRRSDQSKDLDATSEIIDPVDTKTDQENGDKSETKLRRSERTQFNSPSKIEKSDDVATDIKTETKLELDPTIVPLSTDDKIQNTIQAEGGDIDLKTSLTETAPNENCTKAKPEPPKRGRKKVVLSPPNDVIIEPTDTKTLELSPPCDIKEEDIKHEITDSPPAATGTVVIKKSSENEVRTPKKRGRKPGTKLKPKIGSDSKNRSLPVKKSSRITKDGNDTILATAIARKEKCNEHTVAPQRLSRRIKPTPKILANDELRYGFEVQNNARLSISSENLDKDYADLSPPKSEIRRSRSIDDKKPGHQPYEDQSAPSLSTFDTKTEPNCKPMTGNLQRPCPDPMEFLNEIKLAKINLNRSPEDNKKLNFKQKQRLIKEKERHFNKLGLQRTNQRAESSNGTTSSDAEEFVPKVKIHVPKQPGVTLRLRRTTPDAKVEKKSADEIKPTNTHDDVKTNKIEDAESRALKRKCENSLISSTNHKRLSDASRPTDIDPDESRYGISKNIDTNICLCNKPSNYYTRKTMDTSHCRAIDEIDGEHIGCCNEADGEILKLYRPSVRALYMILCRDHRKRLAAHNSCAGCGIFCTQGRFVLCSKNHFFHRDCAIKYILNAPFDPQNNKLTCPTLVLKCPHCGNDAPAHETQIAMKCKNVPVYLPKQKLLNELSAKMSIGSHTSKSAPRPFSFIINLENTIPTSINNLLNKMRIKLNYTRLASITTKDVLYAVHGKDIAQLAEIIAGGFDITTPLPEFRNGTCLHLVSSFGDVTMTYLVLSRATSLEFLNALDSEMRTAIMCAVVGGQNDILKLLIQCGADVTVKGLEGMTALHLAAKNGNITAVKIIIEHYRSVSLFEFEKFINTVDRGGWTAIVWAAEIGHAEMVSYLLNHGADITIQDYERNSLLHWATISNDIDTVGPVLLNGRCDVNGQNHNGDTALHIACRNSNSNICMLLLAYEANLDIRNKEGNRPYDNIRDKEGNCGRVLRFNSIIRKTASDTEKRVLINDISKGREWYPIKVVKSYNTKENKLRGFDLDHHMLPDFKYITKSITLNSFIQIDRRVAQMRICCCSDNCISQSCQCSDVSVQNYYTAEGRLNDQFNYKELNISLFECNDICDCNKLTCRNRVVQQGSRCALQITQSTPKSKGWGVIALTKILKGTFVAEYTGEILNDSEADRRTDDSYFFDLGTSQHCIDANFYGNVSRFFNHSCEPNVVPVRVYFDHQDLCFPKIAFFASSNIDAGVEIW